MTLKFGMNTTRGEDQDHFGEAFLKIALDFLCFNCKGVLGLSYLISHSQNTGLLLLFFVLYIFFCIIVGFPPPPNLEDFLLNFTTKKLYKIVEDKSNNTLK